MGVKVNLDKNSIARIQDEPLMGFPHVGAHYDKGLTSGHRRYSRDDGACCAVCGRRATETHHVIELGMGGKQMPHNVYKPFGVFPLYSPLFALCRECHLKFTLHELEVEWVYDDGAEEDAWVMSLRTGNSCGLFEVGHYEIKRGSEIVKVIS